MLFRSTKGAAVGGIVVRGQNTDVVIDGPLTISNVKADSDRAKGYNGFGIGVTGVGSTVAVNGTVDISGIHGSAILLKESGNKVIVGGGNIAAAADSDKSHNYYAARVEKGTLDINMKDGVAGDTTTTITGDMYINCLHGMKPPSLGSTELVDFKEEGIINVALTNADSYWKGVAAHEKYKTDKHQYGYDLHDVGDLNLYLQNGAIWTNEQQSHATTTTVKDGIWDGSTLASLHGGKDAAHAGNIFQNDSKSLTIDKYSGNVNIFYAHEGNGEAAENYKAGDTVIKSAAAGSAVSLITDNTNVAMDNKDSVANVLNALAGKLTYSNFATGEKNLTGVVKIADGLTASSKALETGDITFNEKGKGTYVKPEPVDDTHFTEKITGALDQKYVDLGIEKDKGVYTFVKDTVINVTKGKDTALTAIGSNGGPVTINAEGKALDISFHASEGNYAARAVASIKYGTGKDITIKAGSLKLSADSVGDESQGIFAMSGSTITIDADTVITTSAKKESNGIFAGRRGTVNMTGNLEINKDTGAEKYYALKTESNGVINANVKDGVAGDGIVKINGDIYTKSLASYDRWDDETTITATTINLALKGADSFWNGSSQYNAFVDRDDTTSYGNFNLWLADGAVWNNQMNGKEVPSGFTGSHVTNFTGGADAAHAGNIFQKDSKNLTIDNYSGNTNIFYAHTGNGEAADNYAAGDTIIKHAEEGSVVSMITDNSGIAMDNEYSVANVLNALAGKLTYSNFATGEKNLTGYVKIADGLTASSKAMQTGDISFSSKDGKGSLKDGSIAPGLTYPDTQTPESSKLNSGITGDAKADYQYKKDGILKEDGSYVFTQDPTVIEVKEGAAVNATAKDIVIDTTKAKLELKGATGINAENGNVTLNGSTVISGTDAAINAGENANVNVNGNNSALTINGSINANGGSITVDSGNASSTITGDINAANGGSVVISLIEKNSVLNGGYNVDGNSSIALSLANGATWNLTDGEEAAGMSLLRIAKAPAAAPAKGLTINGGKTEAETGYLNMTKRSKALQIADYSGWKTIIYNHDNKGSEAQDFKSGNTVINNAKEGSGVILFTDSNNININSQAEVEAVLKVLAEKIQYTDHAANGANLKGKVRIAEGLTSAGKTGVMKWDETTGIGKFDPSSIKWGEIYNGDYETLVMKGVRSAATTSMHSWRDNMQDTYTGADLADADGIFAKALGGKTSSDVKGVKDDNTYRGVQVGYDKALANGWHAGVAFDYRNGDSNYLLGGKGDNQLYSLGVYGVKSFDDQSYLRVAAKAGRVENEYDVYNEIRTLKLHGDYKANAYGLTMEYGKTFGTEASYFTPKAQLTWSQIDAKDYTAYTPNDSMRIDQDAYSSLVARFGVEASAKSEKGRVYVGLYGAHEFNGDISASYFAKDGGTKHTSFDGKDTWMEMSIGGSYDLSDNCHIYADFAKDFGGDFERKWKASAGLRFEF